MFEPMIIATLLAAAVSDAAQNEVSPTVPEVKSQGIEAARIAAAERVLEAMDYDAITEKTIDALAIEGHRQLMGQLQSNPNLSLSRSKMNRLSSTVVEFMRSTMAAHKPNLKRGTALIYARHFSVEELDRLAVLQRDPLMRKFQSELPQISAELMAMNNAMITAEQPKLRAAIQQILQEKEESSSSSVN
jgi:hypothetical protein